MLNTVLHMCKYLKIITWLFIIWLYSGWATPVLAEDVTAVSIPLTAPLVTSTYIPLLPFGADTSTQAQYMPVASNNNLADNHPELIRAVIAIHDQTRDAASMLGLIQELAGPANATTLILAPQFLLEADILRFSNQLPEKGKMFARWSLSSTSSPWEEGGNSATTPPQKGISSFTAIDLLLLYLADRQRFPNLQQIVILGHGAGGDFVQRYAAVGQAADIVSQHNIPVRYIVANPASYLYFTPQRPKNGKHGFSIPDPSICPDYNSYKYGLDHLNDYARRSGGNAIKLRYVTRNIVYLLGEAVPTTDTTPDSNCGAILQGVNRLVRAENYAQYLDMLFGDGTEKPQTFVRLPKVGFSPADLFGSRCGMSALFDDGRCH